MKIFQGISMTNCSRSHRTRTLSCQCAIAIFAFVFFCSGTTHLHAQGTLEPSNEIEKPTVDKPQDLAVEQEIRDLIEAITISKADLIPPDYSLSAEKAAIVDEATARLIQLGEVAVPELTELALWSMLSTRHESITGTHAMNVLISIGPPALPYLRAYKEAHCKICEVDGHWFPDTIPHIVWKIEASLN